MSQFYAVSRQVGSHAVWVLGVWLVAIGVIFQWAAALLHGLGRVAEGIGTQLSEGDLMP
jgi:hypothetical protein